MDMTRRATRVREAIRKNGWVDIHAYRPIKQKRRRPSLPKQWPHWCRRLHLRVDGKARGFDAWRLLIGGGRRWRINVRDEFQASCSHENIDRWANSVAGTFPIPKTYTELLLRVKFTTYDT